MTTKTNVSLWALEREIFQHIVRSAGEERDKERLNLLSKVKDLKSLPDEKLRKIVDCLEEEEYEDSECILRQVQVQTDKKHTVLDSTISGDPTLFYFI